MTGHPVVTETFHQNGPRRKVSKLQKSVISHDKCKPLPVGGTRLKAWDH